MWVLGIEPRFSGKAVPIACLINTKDLGLIPSLGKRQKQKPKNKNSGKVPK
ncbi:hypothetical protein I79_023985 [Cricetulus griseus]|uniref:Uncharacterized protein n=1 Tax=Cricetulus griseus TaxID=10029 RepID=G3IJF1_CRIGR|nr:hypothetical protein I79_023985 [Cricetulus griseus]